jgi:hypothetical protein
MTLSMTRSMKIKGIVGGALMKLRVNGVEDI